MTTKNDQDQARERFTRLPPVMFSYIVYFTEIFEPLVLIMVSFAMRERADVILDPESAKLRQAACRGMEVHAGVLRRRTMCCDKPARTFRGTKLRGGAQKRHEGVRTRSNQVEMHSGY